ncbi:MAG: NAD(P)/FAD-dependent oxidoreductase [Treponema sp.]|nr:NAD(P)/FAD-dependent oxidoreductase [Candidatus Treponema equi]
MEKVFIIGAGFSGLASGVFLAKSGFDVTIFEQHIIPGGLSQGWERKGYRFEGGMHWLTGSNLEAPLYRVWKECGALKENNPIHFRDPFYTYHDGKSFISLYRDIDKTTGELTKASPEDRKAIKKIMSHVKIYTKVFMPIDDIGGIKTRHPMKSDVRKLMGMWRAGLLMRKLKNTSSEEYISKIKDQRIRCLLRSVVGTTYNALSFVYTFRGFCRGDYGNPYGGSSVMIDNMVKEFEKTGGKIRFRSKVDKVIVEDNHAKGLMVNNEFFPCDAVMVSQDTLRAVDELFEIPLKEEWITKMKSYHPSRNCMFFACGADVDLSKYPENMIIPADDSLELGGENFTELRLNNHAGNEYYSKKGTSVITCVLSGFSYDYWKKTKADGTYMACKNEHVKKIVANICRYIPELEGHIQVTDFATPLTYERYCSSWHGSWMSIWSKGEPAFDYPLKSRTIKGLYFEGQRSQMPGGLPVTIRSARKASQLLCKDFNHWWLDRN